MRIYSSIREAYEEIQRDLLEVGIWVKGSTVQDKEVEGNPDFDFMELRPYVYTLASWKDRDDFIDIQKLSRDYLFKEFWERLTNPPNPGTSYLRRREVWSPFLESDGRFSYTYGERLHLGEQISQVMTELRARPGTRQAVLSIFNSLLDIRNVGGRHRIPCSMFYQFLRREEGLEMIYVMRSCDIFTHLPYDLLLALDLLEWIAGQLKTPATLFTHVITSLHGFRKDFGKDVF